MIAIKDMEMPEKCGSCDLFHVESPMHCTVVKGHKTVGAPYGMPRPEWCPLIEINTDGDMISRQQTIDALMQEFRRIPTNSIRAKTVVENLPSAQPEINCSEFPNGSDTISRQAAIDALNHECCCGAVIDHCGLETAMDIISGLPPTQTERITSRWIPCGERTPENDNDVLVQMNDGSMMVDCRAASSNGWFWAELDDEPIAWMPLPEPYKRGEQDG